MLFRQLLRALNGGGRRRYRGGFGGFGRARRRRGGMGMSLLNRFLR